VRYEQESDAEWKHQVSFILEKGLFFAVYFVIYLSIITKRISKPTIKVDYFIFLSEINLTQSIENIFF